MQLAMIGLGKMGGNMTERLLRGGHDVVAFDRSRRRRRRSTRSSARRRPTTSPTVVQAARRAAHRLDHGAGRRAGRRDDRRRCARCSATGDIIIDGGNSNFHDTIRRGDELATNGHRSFIDCGHERRHLGPRERLLPHGRRRARGGEALRADLHDARAGGRLRARRPVRRRALREDGAQRHRVRAAAGVRRGLRDPACVEGFPGSRPAADRRAVAARQRRALVAQRARGARVRAATRRSPRSRATSPTPARDAGRCRKRSTSTCRRR